MESNATMNADLELSENGINGVIGVNEEALAETGQRQMVTQFRDISREESPFQSHNKSRSSSTVGTSISEEQSARLAALVSKYGYQLVKENGQRKLHAPPEWQWPLPARGCEVFIGKLPRDVYEDELIPLFEKCGQIYEMRLMMDFSGANRGYAFVTYTAREEAKRACTELNNYEIRRGRHIGVVLSVDNCRLFVGGIPRNRSKEEVKVEMSKLTEGVMDVILYPSAADKTKNRGFAFVEYESHRAAAKARRKLLPNRVQLWGSVIAVDWAEPEQEVDEATMSQVKVLYVRNLMISTTEDTLRSVFEQASGTAGCIERVKKMRDFAFVHFGTRDQALRARDVLNGAELEGAVIEVVLSKPPYQSNIVRCMKKLQKSGAPRTDNVGTRGNDDFMTAAMRQMYAVDPVTMNNILACTAAPLIPPTSIDQANAQGTNPMINVATALTGLPLIDQYACLSQNLLDRQMSYPGAMGTGNGSKQTGLTEFQITNGNGGRAIRGAAGMRSAGFQAMINNTLRQGGTARRKFSEQLYDCILNQHQQQPPHIQNQQDQQSVLAQHQQGFVPPPGVVLVPTGPGLPGMALWRPIMATPTAAGYVPFIPTGPFAIPAPANVPMVSESSQQNGGRVTTASRVPTTTTGAVSVAQSSSPPIQETQQQQQLAGNAAIYPTAQFFVNGASGAMPIPNYQQGCYVGFE